MENDTEIYRWGRNFQKFLGKDKRMPAGRFFADVLVRSIEELEEKLACEFFVTTQKRGRSVIGYEIMITDTSI